MYLLQTIPKTAQPSNSIKQAPSKESSICSTRDFSSTPHINSNTVQDFFFSSHPTIMNPFIPFPPNMVDRCFPRPIFTQPVP
ncbi:hypothetical protein CFP56_032851 [Quercus suber]|uniref:Uncharacterized protein n=1 Tax=Quercus suber TaxID=58331 RepID=A0AAW0LU12_QUESU